MLSIDEAKKIQKERSKKALARFALFALFDAFAAALSYSLLKEKADMKAFWLIAFAVLLALALQIKYSKIYLFMTPKEFTGTVRYYRVLSETVKDNLSHLPGDTYKTHECLYGEMIVENPAGRSRTKKFVYTEEYNKIDIGSIVTILRFIDRPVINRQADIGTADGEGL